MSSASFKVRLAELRTDETFRNIISTARSVTTTSTRNAMSLANAMVSPGSKGLT